MGIALGPNQYGKAENRVVRVYRDTARHEIRDLNVSTSLRGDFTEAHITGDQADVLPTDTQKNTAFAFAKEKGVTSPEEFALTLGAHFLDAAPKATASPDRDRGVRLGPHRGRTAPGTTTRSSGAAARSAPPWSPPTTARREPPGLGRLRRARTSSSSSRPGSEFKGFLKDEYTTLQETDDRILATSLIARWRYEHTGRRRLEQVLRRHPRDACSRRSPTSYSRRPAADASTRWARRCSRHVPGGRRDQVLRAQQAPLPRRPVAVRRWRTPARSSSPPTGPTA